MTDKYLSKLLIDGSTYFVNRFVSDVLSPYLAALGLLDPDILWKKQFALMLGSTLASHAP